ncbi:MAG: hypothetical protein QOF33_495, partial [Thermomicrobiales bacterium]|nr:hypothetical protein [Thermomicrobiales bacterium]
LVVEVVNALTSAVPGLSVVPTLVKVFNRRLGDPLRRHRLQRQIDEEQLSVIVRLDYQTELLDRLPALFAADLNTAKALDKERPRLVLFFDTHERFWGEIRAVDPGSHYGRDAWLRRLLAALDRQSGIVTVVAGRELPNWDQAPDWKVEDLDVRDVTEFTDADAETFLVRRGVTDRGLDPSLLEVGRVRPNRVHPFFLGIAADIAVRAAAVGDPLTPDELAGSPAVDDGGKAVVERLLRYVDGDLRYAIRALSACRAFSWEICRYLSDERGYGVTRAKFDILSRFSFVTPDPQSPHRPYRMHELLRRLFREQEDEETRTAHAALERHYRKRAESDGATVIAEAIYHANQQDWHRGVNEWVATFEQALQFSRYDECWALVDLRDDLAIGSLWWYGRISSLIGELAARLSRHELAEITFREAVAIHGAATTEDNTDLATINSLGNTLQRLGDLLTRQARHAEAAAAYEQRTAAFDRALALAPDYINALWGRGYSLAVAVAYKLSVAGLETNANLMPQLNEAIASLERAIALAPHDEGKRSLLSAVEEMRNGLESKGEDQ